MTFYWLLKNLHVGSVTLSGALFLLRGFWMMCSSPRLRDRWVRIVPHAIDTVLLASAVALSVMTSQYPFEQRWLTAKVVALFAYVILGSIALKRGRTARIRAAAFLTALLTFAYIVTVALTRHPFPAA